jgi:hypothetical protein
VTIAMVVSKASGKNQRLSFLDSRPAQNHLSWENSHPEAGVLYRPIKSEVLHEEYAKKGYIDGGAPIKTSSDIYIQAPAYQL